MGGLEFWDSGDPDKKVPNITYWLENFQSTRGHIQEVRMHYRLAQDARFLTSIQLVFGRDGHPSETYGFVDEGDKKISFKVKGRDFIIRVDVRKEKQSKWHGLRFRTHNGNVSPWYGYDGSKGDCIDKHYDAPSGHALIGFRGKKKRLWQKLGFEWDVCPTRTICKLDPLVEIKKGTGVQMEREFTMTVGTKSQNYSSNQITTFSALASGKVNWNMLGGTGTVGARTRKAFQSTFDDTSQEKKVTMIRKVDTREHGCFLYRPVITIYLTDGEHIKKYGETIIGSPTRLMEYPFDDSFDDSHRKTSCLSSLSKVFRPAHW